MKLRRLTEEEAHYSEMPHWMRGMMPEPDYGIFVWVEEPVDQEETLCQERLDRGAL